MNPSGSYEFIRRQVHIGLGVPVYTESTYQDSEPSLPCIIFVRNSSTSDQVMEGPGVFFDSIGFSIKAKTMDKREELRDFLIALLDGYDNQITLKSETANFDLSTAIYSSNVDFDVVYKQ